MGFGNYKSDSKYWTKIKWRRDNKAEYTDPHGKAAPEPAIDYKNLEFKKYPDKIKIGIYFDENRHPQESQPQPKKKYDSSGRYIKHKYFVETKKEEKKKYKYSLGQLMRDGSPSNPKNQKDVRRKK